MGGGTGGSLWRHQQWSPSWPPSWILQRTGNQVKTARNGNFENEMVISKMKASTCPCRFVMSPLNRRHYPDYNLIQKNIHKKISANLPRRLTRTVYVILEYSWPKSKGTQMASDFGIVAAPSVKQRRRRKRCSRRPEFSNCDICGNGAIRSNRRFCWSKGCSAGEWYQAKVASCRWKLFQK